MIRQELASRAKLFDDQPFSGESQLRVQGYLNNSPDTTPPNATLVNQSLDGKVALVGYVADPSAAASDYLDVVAYWELLQAVNYNYAVSLQLLDATGQNVAQVDETPLSDMLPITRWQLGKLYREPEVQVTYWRADLERPVTP